MNAKRIIPQALCVGGYVLADSAEEDGGATGFAVELHIQNGASRKGKKFSSPAYFARAGRDTLWPRKGINAS